MVATVDVLVVFKFFNAMDDSDGSIPFSTELSITIDELPISNFISSLLSSWSVSGGRLREISGLEGGLDVPFLKVLPLPLSSADEDSEFSLVEPVLVSDEGATGASKFVNVIKIKLNLIYIYI